MTLPENFRSIEHLQDTIRKVHNPKVRAFFREAKDLDIKTPRGSLKQACLMDDNDPLQATLARLIFYHFDVRKGEEFNEPMYAIPVGSYHETRKFKPQVDLYFKEDDIDVDPDFRPLRTHIKFRLMDHDPGTLKDKDYLKLAKAIQKELARPKLYRLHRGRHLVTYSAPEFGFSFQLYVYDKLTGIDIIKRVLAIRGFPYQASSLNHSENEKPSEAYRTLPTRKTINGKRISEPRKRPVGWVRFQYATLSLWGLPRPVELYDGVGKLKNPIINGLLD